MQRRAPQSGVSVKIQSRLPAVLTKCPQKAETHFPRVWTEKTSILQTRVTHSHLYYRSFAQLDIALLSCGVAISDTGSSANLIWSLYATRLYLRCFLRALLSLAPSGSGLQLTEPQFLALLPDLPAIAPLPRSDDNYSVPQSSSMIQQGLVALRKAFIDFGGNSPDMYVLGSLDLFIAGLEDTQSWVERPSYTRKSSSCKWPLFLTTKTCDPVDASPQHHIDALVNSLNLFQTTGMNLHKFCCICLTSS